MLLRHVKIKEEVKQIRSKAMWSRCVVFMAPHHFIGVLSRPFASTASLLRKKSMADKYKLNLLAYHLRNKLASSCCN